MPVWGHCKTGRILFSVFSVAFWRVKIEISSWSGYKPHVTWVIHTWKWRGCNNIKAIIYELGKGMTGLERGAKPNRDRMQAEEQASRGWKETRESFDTNDIFYNLNIISQSFCQWWMAAIKGGIVAHTSRKRAKPAWWWGPFILIPSSPGRGQGLRSQYRPCLWV